MRRELENKIDEVTQKFKREQNRIENIIENAMRDKERIENKIKDKIEDVIEGIENRLMGKGDEQRKDGGKKISETGILKETPEIWMYGFPHPQRRRRIRNTTDSEK